jgi:hypothetical protein
MSTIADEWAKFAAAVLPEDAPVAQRVMMRRAFYAGATGFVSALSGGLRAAEVEVEDPNTAMQRLGQELDEFSREVWHGRA